MNKAIKRIFLCRIIIFAVIINYNNVLRGMLKKVAGLGSRGASLINALTKFKYSKNIFDPNAPKDVQLFLKEFALQPEQQALFDKHHDKILEKMKKLQEEGKQKAIFRLTEFGMPDLWIKPRGSGRYDHPYERIINAYYLRKIIETAGLEDKVKVPQKYVGVLGDQGVIFAEHIKPTQKRISDYDTGEFLRRMERAIPFSYKFADITPRENYISKDKKLYLIDTEMTFPKKTKEIEQIYGHKEMDLEKIRDYLIRENGKYFKKIQKEKIIGSQII